MPQQTTTPRKRFTAVTESIMETKWSNHVGGCESEENSKVDVFKIVSAHARRLLPSPWSTSKASKSQISNYDEVYRLLGGISALVKNEQTFGSAPNILYGIKDMEELDMVDGFMRDDAVFNLFVLHKSFYQLSAKTYCRAVHILDQFIMRVKVKPKYIACVASAAYHIAAEECEEVNRPTAEELVNLTRCGGTEVDLMRMVAIMRSKLQDFVSGTTAADYLEMFNRIANAEGAYELNMGSSESGSNPFVTRILVSLTCFRVRQYSPSCLALASWLLGLQQSRIVHDDLSDSGGSGDEERNVPFLLRHLARICQVSLSDVKECAELIHSLYNLCFLKALPCSRKQLAWCVSRRTLGILTSAKRQRERLSSFGLVTISENEEIEETHNSASSSSAGAMEYAAYGY